MLLLVLLVRVVMQDGRQQSLLHICSLIQIFVVELVLRIFGRIGFVDVPQQALGSRPNVGFFQIPEFCFQLFEVYSSLFLPDFLVSRRQFTLITLQRLYACLVPACT